VIRSEKQIPIEGGSQVELDIQLGRKGGIFEVDSSTIPDSWSVVADAIEELQSGMVAIIGNTDAGKSTLTTFLVNTLLKREMRLRVVDADIGQADIGPPTTIASAIPTGHIVSLVDLEPERLIFIGSTSPSRVETKLIAGITRLVKREEESLVLVNTDGWVLDPEAILYKIRMISSLDPDLVVGISGGSELQPILSGSKARSLTATVPEVVLARSRSDRRELRGAGYRRYLEGASVRTLSLRNVRLTIPVSLRGLDRRMWRDAIVGLLDSDGFLLEIGIVRELTEDSIKVYAREAKDVREVELGYVKLLADGAEIGNLEP